MPGRVGSSICSKTLGEGALGLWEARPSPGDPVATTPWPKLLTVRLVGEADADTSQL